jgi:hypothetical protein
MGSHATVQSNNNPENQPTTTQMTGIEHRKRRLPEGQLGINKQ